MKNYKCILLDASGRQKTLVQEAATEDALVWEFNRQGFLIVSIEEVPQGSFKTRKKLAKKTIFEFTQTMHALLLSGLGIKETLKIAQGIFPQGETSDLIHEINTAVTKGILLSKALDTWAGSFGSLYLGLIRIGEKTSNLAPIFQKLNDYLALRKQMSDKLGNALVYPSVVLGVAFVGLALLMIFVFPTLSSVVSTVNKSSSEKFETSLSSFEFFMGLGAVVLALLVVGGFALYFVQKKNDSVKLRLDSFFLRVPILGSSLETLQGLYFCFAMETLLQAGYSVEVSLGEAALTLRNAFYKHSVLKIKEDLLKGKDLTWAFKNNRGFSQRMVTWVQIGEKAGDLGRVFSQLRLYYQQEMEKTSSRLMNLAEPALILGVGVVIIFLVLNFITPVFTMFGNLI